MTYMQKVNKFISFQKNFKHFPSWTYFTVGNLSYK